MNAKNIKTIFCLSVLVLGAFFIFESRKAAPVQASDRALCTSTADVVLIMDRSGSMADGGRESSCEWQELEWGENSQYCQVYTQTGVEKSWCLEKSHDSCPESVYTSARDNKMISAQKAGNTFLGLLKQEDQSGLVYFSYKDNEEWLAKLEKPLSSDHGQTQDYLNQLEPFGPTNMGDAIALATQEFGSSRADPQSIKAAILLTDGLANKPFGSGSGEDPQDVAYAITKAEEAGSEGVKIFTIGLGDNGEINEDMLKTIAEKTQAEYYHAPDQEDLEDIYLQISTRLCDYSSVSGCKFNDQNGNGQKDGDESYIEGWEIFLEGNGVSLSQLTDFRGCYRFSGLPGGSYIISEASSSDWVQTFPESGQYELELKWEQNIGCHSFGNQEKEKTGSIQVCKYKDQDRSASTTDDRSPLVDISWEFTLQGGSASSTLNTEPGGHCVVFKDLAFGGYLIQETLPEYWFLLEPEDSEVEINVSSTTPERVDFVNYYYKKESGNGGNGGNGGSEPVCGNGILESGEECDDGNTKNGDGCSSACQKEKTGGGTPIWIFEPETPEEPEPPTPIISTTTPELKIRKTVSSNQVHPGDEITYVVVLTNEGSGKALNVEVSDDLPPGFVYERGDAPEDLLFLEELFPQEQRRMEYKVSIDGSVQPGSYFNQVIVDSDNHETISTSTEVKVALKKEVKGDKQLAPAGFSPREFLLLLIGLIIAAAGTLTFRKLSL